jgi:uncharacterized protein (DUF1015 family)
VVRLILPRLSAGQPGNPYADAAADLRQWLADGILVPDQAPALYVYEQVVPGPAGAGSLSGAPAERLQRGLIGALRLVPPAAGVVRPHEAVAPGPVAGRRQLMEATQANLEPIFLLYDGIDGGPSGPAAASGTPGSAARLVAEVALNRAPLAHARTDDGVRHRLWAITAPGELAAVQADLGARSALIADGHHRYAAYLEIQDRQRHAGRGTGPWDAGLAMLVDSAAYPPDLLAIHRVLPGLAPDLAVKLAGRAFRVRELPSGAADLPAVLASLAEAARHGVSFVVTGGGRAYLLTDPEPAQAAAAVRPDLAPLWPKVPAVVMQDLLLARLWGVADDEPGARAVHDAAEAVLAADEPRGGVAVLLPPMSAAAVYEVAAQGKRLPRKSTSFGPKPRTGLVLRLFAQG